jgi:hypothetical protein
VARILRPLRLARVQVGARLGELLVQRRARLPLCGLSGGRHLGSSLPARRVEPRSSLPKLARASAGLQRGVDNPARLVHGERQDKEQVDDAAPP